MQVTKAIEKLMNEMALENLKVARKKIVELERYDEINKYGYAKEKKNLIKISEVIGIIDEMIGG